MLVFFTLRRVSLVWTAVSVPGVLAAAAGPEETADGDDRQQDGAAVDDHGRRRATGRGVRGLQGAARLRRDRRGMSVGGGDARDRDERRLRQAVGLRRLID